MCPLPLDKVPDLVYYPIAMNRVDPIRDYREVEKLKRVAKERSLRDFVIIVFGLNTALRARDLLALQVNDVIDEAGRIKDEFVIREGKTGRERVIKVNRPMREALTEYLSANQHLSNYVYLFPAERSGPVWAPDRPLKTQSFYLHLKKYAVLAGIKGRIGMHSLRKTWGYFARKEGTPWEIIAEALNHQAPAVTRRYLGITQEEVVNVYTKVEI